jgi:hypothetical protein
MIDMDLNAMFEGTVSWMVDCLKSSGRFHNMAIVIAPRLGCEQLVKIPGARLIELGEEKLFEGQPADLGHLIVPLYDMSTQATLGRLMMLARSEPKKLEGLQLLVAVCQEVESTGEVKDAFGILGRQLTKAIGADPMDIAMAHVRDITEVTKASAVFVTTETWILRGPKPDGFKGSLKDLPDSKEALFISLVTRAGVQRACSITFTREEKPGQERGTGPVVNIEPPDHLDGLTLTGRLTEVFAPAQAAAS